MNKKHLIEMIEMNMDFAWNSEEKEIRDQGQQLAENYALQYKELTGHYYVRECKR